MGEIRACMRVSWSFFSILRYLYKDRGGVSCVLYYTMLCYAMPCYATREEVRKGGMEERHGDS